MTISEQALREPRKVNGDNSWDVLSNYYFCPILCPNCKYFRFENSNWPYHCRGPHSLAASHTSRKDGFKQYDYCYCYKEKETAPVETKKQTEDKPVEKEVKPSVATVEDTPVTINESETEKELIGFCYCCSKIIYDNEDYIEKFYDLFHKDCYTEFINTSKGQNWLNERSELNAPSVSEEDSENFEVDKEEIRKQISAMRRARKGKETLPIGDIDAINKRNEKILTEFLNSDDSKKYLSENDKKKFKELLGEKYISDIQDKIERRIYERKRIEDFINQFTKEQYEGYLTEENILTLSESLKNAFDKKEFEKLDGITDTHFQELPKKHGFLMKLIVLWWNVSCVFVSFLCLLATFSKGDNSSGQRIFAAIVGIVFLCFPISGIGRKKSKIAKVQKHNFDLINDKIMSEVTEW